MLRGVLVIYVCVYARVCFVIMEALSRLGVSGELSKDEFVRQLSCLRQEQVEDLRSELFGEAGLADSGDDTLVGRRKVIGGKTMKMKYMDDVWILVGAIKRCEYVPRTLLKNGKRSKAEWMRSQEITREVRSTEDKECSVLSMGGCDLDAEGIVKGTDCVHSEPMSSFDKGDNGLCTLVQSHDQCENMMVDQDGVFAL